MGISSRAFLQGCACVLLVLLACTGADAHTAPSALLQSLSGQLKDRVASIIDGKVKLTPTEKAVKLLGELEKNVQTHQEKEKTLYADESAACERNIKKQQKIKDESSLLIATLTAAIAENAALHDRLSSEMQELEKQSSQAQDSLQTNTKNRLEENRKYMAKATELSAAVRQLALAAEALKTRGGDRAKAEDLSVKYGFDASNSDPQQVVKVMLGLRADVQQNIKDLEIQETKAQEEYGNMKTALENTMRTSKAALQEKRILMAETEQQISRDKGALADAQRVNTEATSSLTQLTSGCEARTIDFETQTKARANQLKALASALEMMTNGKAKDAFQHRWGAQTTGNANEKTDTKTAVTGKTDTTAHATEKTVPAAPAAANPHTETAHAPAHATETAHAPAEHAHTKEETHAAPAHAHGHSFLQIGARAHAHADKNTDTIPQVVNVNGVQFDFSKPVQSAVQLKAMEESRGINDGGLQSETFAKIRRIITDLIERLLSEANKEATQKGWCDSETAKSNAQKTDKEKRLKTIEEKLDEMRARAQKLRLDIAKAETALEKSQSSRAHEETRHKELAAQLTAEKTDNADAQKILSFVIELISGAFTDTPAPPPAHTPPHGKAAAVAKDAHTNAHKQEKKQTKSWFSAGVSLLQTTSVLRGVQRHGEVPQLAEGAKGVVAMLEVSRDEFKKLEAAAQLALAVETERYASFVQEAKMDEVSWSKDIEHMRETLQRIETDIARMVVDQRTLKEGLVAVEKYLETLKGPCVGQPATYEDRVNNRKKEIENLQEALRILQSV